MLCWVCVCFVVLVLVFNRACLKDIIKLTPGRHWCKMVLGFLTLFLAQGYIFKGA